MGNRHERRRAMKLGTVERMSVKYINSLPSLCAWDGCYAAASDPDKQGWSKMVLYKGETQVYLGEIAPQDWTRDCVLCPEHAQQLDEQLLINIGGRLRQTAGTA